MSRYLTPYCSWVSKSSSWQNTKEVAKFWSPAPWYCLFGNKLNGDNFVVKHTVHLLEGSRIVSNHKHEAAYLSGAEGISVKVYEGSCFSRWCSYALKGIRIILAFKSMNDLLSMIHSLLSSIHVGSDFRQRCSSDMVLPLLCSNWTR